MKKIILTLAILMVPAGSCFASTAVASASVISTEELVEISELYRRSLPTLTLKSASTDLAPKAKAEAILEYLQCMGGGPALTGTSRSSYLSSLEASITSKSPIQMVILGFSFKSHNPKKVLPNCTFDMADYLGLIRLEYLAYEIERVIGVACEIHIVNKEPHVEDVFALAAQKIGIKFDHQTYEKTLRRLLPTCPHLRLSEDLRKLYYKERVEKKNEASEAIQRLFLQELEGADLIRKELVDKQKMSKAAMMRFLEPLSKEMAIEYETGVEIFRAVVSAHKLYGHMMRLSVHGDENKVMMNFAHIPGTTPEKRTCTSWHGTLLCTRSTSGVSFDLTQASKTAGAKLMAERIQGIDLAYMLLEAKAT